MAYVNVQDWNQSNVADWLQGLDLQPAETMKYCESFRNNQILGSRLLHLTVSDLIKLNVEKLGHQEIILEGLEKLKNLHYNLSTENLQFIALKLSCKARSLHNEICLLENNLPKSSPNPAAAAAQRQQKVDTTTMSAVADVLDALMTMLSWLDKPPFGSPYGMSTEKDQNLYKEFWKIYVNLGIKLATNAQRDTFAENPVQVIKECCLSLASCSDRLIQDFEDPMILQPSSLEVVKAKKRPGEEDFGITIDTAVQPHLISEVRFGSLAYQCGRIHQGDEIVQVNYQTVVGWSTKKVLEEINNAAELDFEEEESEMVLTLKKVPSLHRYTKPYPIQTKKSQVATKQVEIPARILSVSDSKRRSAPELKKVADNTTDSEDEADIDDLDDDVYLPPTSTNKDLSPTQSVRSLILRPRSTPIRRATISAGSPSKHQPYMNVSEIWTASLYDTARSTKSNNSDGASKHSSASSTMHSNDSGCATMYSSGGLNQDFLVNKSPSTAEPISSEYINMHQEEHHPKEDYINLFACSTLAATGAAAGKRHPPPPPLLPPKREFDVSLRRMIL